MFSFLKFILVVILIENGVHALIIPEELPSILSLIYSNIPPIKKGTDSRVGFGFRLGEHADFQIVLELGPQTETKPLGNAEGSNNKRHTPNRGNLAQFIQQKQKPTKLENSNTDGGKWLSTWKQSMQSQEPDSLVFTSESEPIEGIGEIRASDVIPDDNVSQLSKLYNSAKRMKLYDDTNIETSSHTSDVKSSTEKSSS